MNNIKYKSLAMILVFYIFFLLFFTNYIDVRLFSGVLNPLFWIIIMFYSYYISSNYHGRFSNLKENQKTLFIFALFYIIFYYLSGLIFTYLRSPYSKEIVSIIKNFIQIIIPIICLEYSRSTIINENKKKHISIIFITIIFILLEIADKNFLSNFSSRESTFIYICSVILPVVFSNIIYSYLSLKGSYKLVLTYRLPVEITSLLVPVFPNFDWFMTGLLGILVPVMIYVVLKYYINIEKMRRSTRKKANPIIYIPLLTVIIIFALFMVGFFKYKPIAILTNSMNPIFYRGDVVIYRKLNGKELKKLKKDYIIIYSIEGQTVVHRIVDSFHEKGDIYYITKGDANNSNDLKPVSPDNIIGLYQTSIKSIGKPSVWLHDFFKNEKAVVEIK